MHPPEPSIQGTDAAAQCTEVMHHLHVHARSSCRVSCSTDDNPSWQSTASWVKGQHSFVDKPGMKRLKRPGTPHSKRQEQVHVGMEGHVGRLCAYRRDRVKNKFSYPTTTTRHRRIPEECGSLLRQRSMTTIDPYCGGFVWPRLSFIFGW